MPSSLSCGILLANQRHATHSVPAPRLVSSILKAATAATAAAAAPAFPDTTAHFSPI
ncbi:hypothetical protein PR003_g27809 [Phytophthora rubi]|uniref:Uncharacterized protein n=1 Tax=Phytophthora rubi TaxID=129364 RepID=A0A6A4BXL1_9STRA|nr:hypothetical protein PR003_g27809 [Phytophthora rubi]